MKFLQQIELIKKIRIDPVPFIGQRSFKLLQAYLLPSSFYTEFDVPEADKTQLSNYPSIQEEMDSIYNNELGNRGWWNPLKYGCEDERAHFELAIDFMLDYDKKYPNPSNNIYQLKLNSPIQDCDLLKNLGHIGFRPEMYFEVSELANLRAFIDGHFHFKSSFNLPYSSFEKKLLEFIEPYKIEGNKDFKTWDRNYRWKWDFAVYGSNERHAIPRFFKDIEEYTGFEFTVRINDKEIKLDWMDYQSWWNKPAGELYEQNKIK